MRNTLVEYPHPVLNEYLKDYKNGAFELSNLSVDEEPGDIVISLSYNLKCPGIEKLIEEGIASVYLRVTCFRTSYRTVYQLYDNDTRIEIKKANINDSVDMQAIIVAKKEYDSFLLPEFNETYFGGMSFKLRKGDVIANESGMKIKLQSVLEQNSAGVVQIRQDNNITSLTVHYATIDETDARNSDYIYVSLPPAEMDTYKNLTKKKYLKYGIERFLQAALFLPAITEAVGRIRNEEETEDPEYKYSGTIWADSLLAAMKKHEIDPSDTLKSDYEIANTILGDVAKDSIDNLMKKMNDWSTIKTEEDIL